MKKAVHIGIYSMYPTLLAAVFSYLSNKTYYIGDGFAYLINIDIVRYGFLAVCYGLPFLGFYYFCRVRPFNQWLLWIGFSFAPMYYLVYEYLNPPVMWQYFTTIIVTLFYALPFVILFLIFASIITRKDRRSK